MKIFEKIYNILVSQLFKYFFHPLLKLIYKNKPFKIIHVDIARIGNFALSSEAFLRNLYLKNDHSKKYLFYSFDRPANVQLYKMYSEKMKIILIPNFFVKFLDPVVNVLKPTKLISSLRQLNNEYLEFNKAPPQISFSQNELLKGEEFLARLGIKPSDRIVCFHSRNSHYLQKNFDQKAKDFSYHDYRDCQISNYLPAIEFLTKNGIYCFRMGASAESVLETNNPKIIDYANKYRSDFLDIFLVHRSLFFLGCTAGLQCVAQVFNIPVATTNYVPWPHPPLRFQDLVIYKQLLNTQTNDLLSFEVAKEKGFLGMHFSYSQNYSEHSLKVLENTGEDILALVQEMLEQVESGKCEMSQAQLEFKNNFLKTHPYFVNNCELSGRVANFMIKKYPEVYTIK